MKWSKVKVKMENFERNLTQTNFWKNAVKSGKQYTEPALERKILSDVNAVYSLR